MLRCCEQLLNVLDDRTSLATQQANRTPADTNYRPRQRRSPQFSVWVLTLITLPFGESDHLGVFWATT